MISSVPYWISPKALGWYEAGDGGYVLTEDTQPDSTKSYYAKRSDPTNPYSVSGDAVTDFRPVGPWESVNLYYKSTGSFAGTQYIRYAGEINGITCYFVGNGTGAYMYEPYEGYEPNERLAMTNKQLTVTGN